MRKAYVTQNERTQMFQLRTKDGQLVYQNKEPGAVYEYAEWHGYDLVEYD